MGRGGRHSCGPHREETTLFSTPSSSPAATPTLSTTLELQVTVSLLYILYNSRKLVEESFSLVINSEGL